MHVSIYNYYYYLLATVTCNQVQSFQVNDYANHNVDIEITGYRELYSINCKQQCLHVYNIYVCVCCLYTKSLCLQLHNYPTSVI